jgi:transposase InsO family protein
LTADAACGLFGYSRQAYYQGFRRGYESSTEVDRILEAVRRIRQRHPKMGARKLKVVLKRDYGVDVGRDSLFDIMRGAGLLVRRRNRHRRTTFSGHGLRTYPNMIKDLVPSRPDEVWVTDITYLYVEGKSFYIFLVTDAYSRMVVGWKVADNMRAGNAIDALKMALHNRNPRYRHLPIIHHSDRGSQYCSLEYVRLMEKNRMVISMTEGGDPRDNPVAERVNGTVKNEYLYPLQVCMSGLNQKVHKAMRLYNVERPHLSLNMNTPEHVYRTGCETHRLWKNYYPYYDDVSILD